MMIHQDDSQCNIKTFYCHYSYVPTKSGGAGGAGGGRGASDGSVISYSPQSDRDYGTLLCWARNDIGEQREPCVYRIFLGGDIT